MRSQEQGSRTGRPQPKRFGEPWNQEAEVYDLMAIDDGGSEEIRRDFCERIQTFRFMLTLLVLLDRERRRQSTDAVVGR